MYKVVLRVEHRLFRRLDELSEMHELAFVLENPSDVVTPQNAPQSTAPQASKFWLCLIWEYAVGLIFGHH